MNKPTFIYWDDWRDEIIKNEIPDGKNLKFNSNSKKKIKEKADGVLPKQRH